MKKVLFFLLLTPILFCFEPETKQLKEYFELMQTYSSTIGFSAKAREGEIELLTDPEKIALALKKTGRDVGIVYQDKYWIWINDPVQFPNGNVGVYGRILSRSSLKGFAGCAVVPCFKDGRIALNCNFRHATRSWELEIPRGFSEEGESPESCAKREALEETGLLTEDLIFLGEMAPDSGKSSSIVALFMAKIKEQREAKPEESEAIAKIVILPAKELRKALLKGSTFIEIKGKKKEVFLRDPFLTFALVQMSIRGLFSFES
jgi:ADP-ribose pyrophosphatase